MAMLTGRLAAAMARSIAHRIEVCQLDLTNWVVVTEAATGAYASTAGAAAAAGAEVWAFADDSPYGTVDDARRDMAILAEALGSDVEPPTIVTERGDLPLGRTDLVTNSGLLRPIDAPMIDQLPATAVIALMYEGWETRNGDIDLAAAAERGVSVIAVDEHHPACDAFRFVGDLAVAAALRRGWAIRGMRVSVLSDNPFGDPVVAALRSLGADAHLVDGSSGPVPSVEIAVVAMTPATSSLDGSATLSAIAVADHVVQSGAFAVVQLWGDIDRSRLTAAGVMIEPEVEPRPGHQGIPMSDAGYEAVVRLQVGAMAAAVHASEDDGALSGLGRELLWVRP